MIHYLFYMENNSGKVSPNDDLNQGFRAVWPAKKNYQFLRSVFVITFLGRTDNSFFKKYHLLRKKNDLQNSSMCFFV